MVDMSPPSKSPRIKKSYCTVCYKTHAEPLCDPFCFFCNKNHPLSPECEKKREEAEEHRDRVENLTQRLSLGSFPELADYLAQLEKKLEDQAKLIERLQSFSHAHGRPQ